MQAQIQALLAAVGGGEDTARGSNMGSQLEVAKPAIFNGEAGKVGGSFQHVRFTLGIG